MRTYLTVRYDVTGLTADQTFELELAAIAQAEGVAAIAYTTVTHEHDRDMDCIGHIVNDMCTVCGVYHGDPCARCGGRGFHKPDCIDIG